MLERDYITEIISQFVEAVTRALKLAVEQGDPESYQAVEQQVADLIRRVTLCFPCGLALSQHQGCSNLVAVLALDEVSCLREDGKSVLYRKLLPALLDIHGRIHGILKPLGIQTAELRQLERVVVRCDNIVAVVGIYFFASDDGRDDDGILLLEFQLCLQQLALLGAGCHAGGGDIGGIVDFNEAVHGLPPVSCML